MNKGKEIISAFLEYPNGTSLIVGSVIAKSGCWSMLKGGFTVEEDMHANIYFVVLLCHPMFVKKKIKKIDSSFKI